MRRRAADDLPDALHVVVEQLRSHRGLRDAVIAAGHTSALGQVAAELRRGEPIAATLSGAAETSADPDVSAALTVLAVHASAGGDPLEAVSALATRVRRRQAARREADAVTSQARLSARVLLSLTPGFLALLAAADPGSLAASLGESRVRVAVGAGVVLQALGALWISSIVRNAVPSRRPGWSQLPVLRAVRALVAGKHRSTVDLDVADAADTMAFLLDAGLTPLAALDRVAPTARGEWGRALRGAVTAVHGGTPIGSAVTAIGEEGPQARFAAAVASAGMAGVPLAPTLRSLSDDLRERAGAQLTEDVRRASVRVLVPLGLLVLPAFVCVCLVPLLAGGLEGITG